MKLNKKKINILMARKCWKRSDLAKAYGVSSSRINIILGAAKVSTVVAGRMAAALGVDVTEIIEA